MSEIHEAAFHDLFPGLAVEASTPRRACKRAIVGNLPSLVPLESAWCRGSIILVNHRHRCISFGSESPQLGVKFRLRSADTDLAIAANQRLVFSLNRSPDAFSEFTDDCDCSASAGDLDMF